MTVIKRSALVNYSAQQMFELVNQVADYPRFLPWCRSSQILSQSEQELQATLEIAWAGIHKKFTTRNILYPYEAMEIILVEGPFRHLTGHWVFLALKTTACKVSLELEFELTGSFFDKAFSPIFHHIANSLVDAFCQRAIEIYGN